jgi:hypothetical protein
MSKKPTLRLLDANKKDVDEIANLYFKLTGKKMSKDERAYAEVKLKN